jgi:hypothetical protein
MTATTREEVMVGRIRRGAFMVIAVGAWLLWDGLLTEAGETQATLPAAGLYPWCWLAVACSSTVASMRVADRVSMHGLRLSSWMQFLTLSLVASTAMVRGFAWAASNGWMASRSVWGVWVVVFGICMSAIACGLTLLHRGVMSE